MNIDVPKIDPRCLKNQSHVLLISLQAANTAGTPSLGQCGYPASERSHGHPIQAITKLLFCSNFQ